MVVLIPVLGRPHRVDPVLESLRVNTAPGTYDVLFLASPHDCTERAELDLQDAPHLVVPFDPSPGDYARKINYGYHQTLHPWLFLGADDLYFHKGWLENAALFFHDENAGVIGTQDMGNPRVKSFSHSTHSFVSRGYVQECGTIDEPDKVLHEGYMHEYVDDEFVETAKFRKRWKFCQHSVVEHLHPHWGKAKTDPLYDQFDARLAVGQRLYMERRHLWAPWVIRR